MKGLPPIRWVSASLLLLVVGSAAIAATTLRGDLVSEPDSLGKLNRQVLAPAARTAQASDTGTVTSDAKRTPTKTAAKSAVKPAATPRPAQPVRSGRNVTRTQSGKSTPRKSVRPAKPTAPKPRKPTPRPVAPTNSGSGSGGSDDSGHHSGGDDSKSSSGGSGGSGSGGKHGGGADD